MAKRSQAYLSGVLQIPDGWVLQNIFPSPLQGPDIWIVLFKARDRKVKPPLITLAGQGSNAQQALYDAIEEMNKILAAKESPTQQQARAAKINRTRIKAKADQ